MSLSDAEVISIVSQRLFDLKIASLVDNSSNDLTSSQFLLNLFQECYGEVSQDLRNLQREKRTSSHSQNFRMFR